MHHFEKKKSKIFSPAPTNMFGGPTRMFPRAFFTYYFVLIVDI